MTAPIKSVLFIDYDSLYLSLRNRDPGIARRFASRPGVWMEAIEAGLLVDPKGDTPVKRRILMRRCYADPKLLGKARGAFANHGFQIIDCPPLAGRERNSAEIHMVLDTVDALAHQTGFEEFILLSADSDLTPVMFRLRAYNRATTIYSTSSTAAGYRAIAEGIIDEQALIALLAPTADAEAPEADAEAPEGASPGRAQTSDRGELAGLARRINQATNVPLFSPKAYAELFRTLAREIDEHGYHFQATAENVAARLVANGRNVSRRQIAFVIKGLALKGHVFSEKDSPERLAEVFKEQVLFLTKNSGIELDETTEEQIQNWIVSRAPAGMAPELPPSVSKPVERPAPKLTPIPSAPLLPPLPVPALREVKPITLPFSGPIPQPIRPITVRPIETSAPVVPQPAAPVFSAPAPAARAVPQPIAETAPEPEIEENFPEPEAAPAATVVEPPQPARVERLQAARPVVIPEPRRPPVVVPPAEEPEILFEEPDPEPAPPRTAIAPPRARTRPTAVEAPQEPTPRTALPARAPGPRTALAPLRPPARRAPGNDRPATESGKDPIESSILAAIAEAVDVLVDDGDVEPAAPAPAPATRAPIDRPRPAPRQEAPQPEPQSDKPESDADIGDEIQRILAAYSQNRTPPTRR